MYSFLLLIILPNYVFAVDDNKNVFIEKDGVINYYETISDAVSSASVNETTTLVLLNDIELGAVITIDANKDIIIDGNNNYIFDGWEIYTDDMTMPANNIIFVAKWVKLTNPDTSNNIYINIFILIISSIFILINYSYLVKINKNIS